MSPVILTAVSAQRARTLSGSAFPGETLRSNVYAQWYVDDVPVGGVSTTYQVALTDIGKTIRQAGQTVVAWHPTQIAGLVNCYLGQDGVLHSVSPDIEAAESETVRRWNDVSGNAQHLNQATGTQQPTRSGMNVQFDGADDRLVGPSTTAAGNAEYVYFLAAFNVAVPQGDFVRAAHYGDYGPQIMISYVGTQDCVVGAYNEYGGSFYTGIAARPAGPFVIGVESVFAAQLINMRINGNVASSGPLYGSKSSANPIALNLGHVGFGTVLNGACGGIATIARTTPLTVTERSQIERFLGLFVGCNIPLL